MKRITTLAILAIFFQTAFAFNQGAMLNLRMSDNSAFKIYINGQLAAGVSNKIHLENLPGGRNFIQIYTIDNNWGYESLDNAYRGYIEIQPCTESFVTVNPVYHSLNFDRVIALNIKPAMGRDAGMYTARERNHSRPVVYEQPVACGPVAMNPNDFAALKNTICNASFESTKLTIFKQALAYNYFSTSQVLDLMNLFVFESYKLDVAKLSYPKTVDQNNYYLVNNGFTFSSSVNDLSSYVAMR